MQEVRGAPDSFLLCMRVRLGTELPTLPLSLLELRFVVAQSQLVSSSKEVLMKEMSNNEEVPCAASHRYFLKSDTGFPSHSSLDAGT